MAVPTDIGAGLLTPADAARIAVAGEFAEASRQKIAKWRDNLPEEFPVKLTAYDSATGACSGKLQTYDENGQRVDHWNGLQFSPTNRPLFPVGNGIMPPPSGFGSSGIQVQARRRILRSGGDPTYEFDWICACAFYSGGGIVTSGQGSGGMLGRDLCPNGIAQTGTATISAPGCPELNGQVITLTYSFLLDWWEGLITVNGYVYELIMFITAAGPQISMFSGPGGPSTYCTPMATGSYSCGPPFTVSPIFRCPNSPCPTTDLLVNISI